MTLRTLPMSPRTALARIAAIAIAIAIAAIAAIALGPPAVAAEAPAEIRLYAMDCGHLDFKDLSFFSDTGDYDGKSGSLADPCFLIRHPKGILLWDTGLSPEFAKQGNPAAGISGGLDVPVTTQLQQAGLTPANITYVAFSISIPITPATPICSPRPPGSSTGTSWHGRRPRPVPSLPASWTSRRSAPTRAPSRK